MLGMFLELSKSQMSLRFTMTPWFQKLLPNGRGREETQDRDPQEQNGDRSSQGQAGRPADASGALSPWSQFLAFLPHLELTPGQTPSARSCSRRRLAFSWRLLESLPLTCYCPPTRGLEPMTLVPLHLPCPGSPCSDLPATFPKHESRAVSYKKKSNEFDYIKCLKLL